jgi:hypothetical protein
MHDVDGGVVANSADESVQQGLQSRPSLNIRVLFVYNPESRKCA